MRYCIRAASRRFASRFTVSTAGLTLSLLGLTLGPLPAQEAVSREAFQRADAPAGAMWLDALTLNGITQDYGEPHAGHSVDNNPLTLGGVTYPHGLGTHARSVFRIDLRGTATRFTSLVGVDDETKTNGSVVFEVWVDGQKKASSPVLHGGDAAQTLTVDLTGAKKLTLIVNDAGDGFSYDHADWAGAMLTLAPNAGERPQATPPPPVEPPPPIHSGVAPRPAIHGPLVVGTTPGRPFVFRVPVTGESPFTFSVRHLPAGLTLDPQSGVIAGTLQTGGTYRCEISVRGAKGQARRDLTIVGAPRSLALTPPLGWNSWNVWAGAVDQEKIRQAGEVMLSSGLAAHGYAYVNVDDTWEAGRDANGEIQTNKKFPDMKALSDELHSKGLKFGIYSSPGSKTCGGYEASWQHEKQDALTYARWGVDYLKYDWCSYTDVATGEGLERMQKPYRVMRDALDAAPRDIVYSLCQYGMGDVWKWGANPDIGGNCWRTTGDIVDTWGSMSGNGFNEVTHTAYAGPGHWNDPDMLVVGKLGWGPSIHPTRLTPNEQITHITLWVLQATPLLLGCDLTQLDKFTLDLMTNDEVLDVEQDPLGKAARRVAQSGETEVWARPLWDGTFAVGLFNRGDERAEVTANWSDLGVKGKQPVRDLWLWQNLPVTDNAFTSPVPAHGAVFIKIGRPTRKRFEYTRPAAAVASAQP